MKSVYIDAILIQFGWMWHMLCAVLPVGPCFPGGPAGVGLEEDHEYEGIVC